MHKRNLAGAVLATAALTGAATLATAPAAAQTAPEGSAPSIELTEIGRYVAAGAEFDEGGAEIVAHDAGTQRLFVANGAESTVDVLDISEPADPILVRQVDLSEFGPAITGVGARDGVVGVAVQPADARTAPGTAVFLDADSLETLADVETGFGPDALLFSPDASVATVANEGEPSDDYSDDPVGTVTVVDLATFTPTQVTFDAITAADLDDSVRIFGPDASIQQDIEPENVTYSADSSTVYVTLQENNAIATVDIATAMVTDVVGLGFKDWRTAGNGFDASNAEDAINIRDWPVLGIPQPDSLAAYDSGGETFLITANEGDARDYDGFSEEQRLADVQLCAGFQDYSGFTPAQLQQEENLGRLNITTATGFNDAADCVEEIHAYGGRSLSIYTPGGELVYDSGSDFEEITAEVLGTEGFNASNNSVGADDFDARSDDKGPEPEGAAVGEAFGETYAFIGLERVGGVMTYQVTDPTAPEFVSYTNGRDFQAATAEESVDLGPEGVLFVPAQESPVGSPLVVLSHEVTGSTTIYQVDPVGGTDGGTDDGGTPTTEPTAPPTTPPTDGEGSGSQTPQDRDQIVLPRGGVETGAGGADGPGPGTLGVLAAGTVAGAAGTWALVVRRRNPRAED